MSESDVSAYKQETTTSNSFLDPHHTHFIMIDNEEEGSEINFRSKFESRDIYSGSTHANFVHVYRATRC